MDLFRNTFCFSCAFPESCFAFCASLPFLPLARLTRVRLTRRWRTPLERTDAARPTDAEAATEAVGVLTTESRATWARLREQLAAHDPDGTRSKLAAWAGNQQADGMLAEQILNKNPDAPQGRVMSDGSSMFIVMPTGSTCFKRRWSRLTPPLDMFEATCSQRDESAEVGQAQPPPPNASDVWRGLVGLRPTGIVWRVMGESGDDGGASGVDGGSLVSLTRGLSRLRAK